MTSCSRELVVGMALIVCVLATGRAQQAKTPGKDVVSLAQESEAGKDVAKKAAGLRKGFGNVRNAMQLYNRRSRGGIGYGPKGRGIEARLVQLGDQAMNADSLKKESAELVRVAHINLVMAEIIRGYAPEKPFLGRGKKEWERDVAAMKTGSRMLVKALQSGDPKAVQAAASQINNACNSCHDGQR